MKFTLRSNLDGNISQQIEANNIESAYQSALSFLGYSLVKIPDQTETAVKFDITLVEDGYGRWCIYAFTEDGYSYDMQVCPGDENQLTYLSTFLSNLDYWSRRQPALKEVDEFTYTSVLSIVKKLAELGWLRIVFDQHITFLGDKYDLYLENEDGNMCLVSTVNYPRLKS